ncbi:MAG TPA: M48 family metallopeptidase [Longimicrobium sp.]
MLSREFHLRLEDHARLHPRQYKVRVALLAVLGYVYLLAALLVLAGIVAGLIWFIMEHLRAYVALKAIIPLLVLIGMVGKSLWVKLLPPEGTELRPGEAPALTAEIERVRAAMSAPRIYKVLLTDDHNAAVAQHARWGVLGGYRTYLMLGLPLMGSLSPEEFRAVLAHEFGHVSRAHGRFGAWIVRVRGTWFNLMTELDRANHWGQGLFRRFFHWYVPYFDAYTSVLSRAQEFEADRLAESVSPGGMGASLVRMEITGRYLGRVFWPAVTGRTRSDPEPPARVHHALLADVVAASADARATEWLGEAMAEETQPGSSHPALRDRLSALGCDPIPPPPLETTAAQALLGPRLQMVADGFSRTWQAHVNEPWRSEHQQALELAQKLADLEARAAESPLAPAEAGERIWLTAQVHGQEIAIPMARAFVDADQEDASVHFLLGRAMAQQDDEGALPHLQRAVGMDVSYTIPACLAASALLQRLGRAEESAAYHRRAVDWDEKVGHANHERSAAALTPSDVFLPHGLDDDSLARVRAHLAGFALKRAYLVRKYMKHFPDQPLHVLAIETTWGSNRASARNTEGLQRLMDGLPLPGAYVVVRMNSWRSPYRKPIRAVRAAEVYSSAKRGTVFAR